jgi:hypothetical protein
MLFKLALDFELAVIKHIANSAKCKIHTSFKYFTNVGKKISDEEIRMKRACFS